ncbi:type I polyketide synthase, partial [Streptomyces sp. ISL-14]|nr:type I polyketide synthase [Streptomyces sp. ISL-14]
MAKAHHEAVAVIGIGCRFPGGADSPQRLWDLLVAGVDAVGEIPPDRWDAQEFYDPEPGVPGRTVSRWGGFLENIGGFDAGFFGIADREAASMDPQHRLLLETAWEAVEHAGIAPLSLAGSRTGVFVGLSHGDYELVSHDAGALSEPYGFTGNAFSMASGRIAYALGLCGPAITIDTACSSGLMAVHLASRSLLQGESDMALAGGCLLIMKPEVHMSASGLGMLSPSGRCRAFDKDADGFVRSEGAGVVLLKRLSDALRDGDRILAVVRGTAANQDGRSGTITMPLATAQAAVHRAALAAAGVAAGTVGMVEAHGTGTPVGDPVEFVALAEVYGRSEDRCAVGSLKSNIGHTEAAAGVAGLIKAVLALQHGIVPPSLHFTAFGENVRHQDTGLFVPTEVTPWPVKSEVRRAAVSSFGMSGTNVHAVLEQAPQRTPVRVECGPPAGNKPLLCPVSATSTAELRRTAERIADWLTARQEPVQLSDVAYTLARR